MPIILGRRNVVEVYRAAAERGWVVPTFCAENQTTVEAILSACQVKAGELGVRVPVTVAMTGRYAHRPQAMYYAASHNPETGIELFLGDCEVLARPSGDYPDVAVLTHLDHGQPDEDAVTWAGDLSRFSSVMYDASAFPWAENLARTAEFVAVHRDELLIEGAADEVVDATGSAHADLTTPERAEEFVAHTGADMVVANLGTEHRAAAADLAYHPETARAISERIGTKLVLHGTSSVPIEQLATLYGDGVCKVNIWTALERDTSPVLFRAMVEHADAVAGGVAAELAADGLLGPNAPISGRPNIAYFTTAWRQQLIGQAMLQRIRGYLDLWYR